MWIQHPELGAFSIVLADDLITGQPDPDRVMIRARRREHLELLRSRHAPLGNSEIIESPPSHDYRYRLVAAKAELAAALVEVVQGLNYRNVKAQAAAHQEAVGRPFVAALHRIWSALRDLQR